MAAHQRALAQGLRRGVPQPFAVARYHALRSAWQRALPRAGAGRGITSTSAGDTSNGGGTRLAQYLEACGANWGEAAEVPEVEHVGDARVSWRLELPADRLQAVRPGVHFESRPFSLKGPAGEIRARLQFFPRGDVEAADGHCSLWLCADSSQAVRVRMSAGNVQRDGGASDFCRLEDVLDSGSVTLGVEALPPVDSPCAASPAAPVHQSLQLNGLQFAEWRLFNAASLLKAGALVSSPPFRFHHVLLGDMYLEMQPGAPHAEHCAIFFRCRVPTMKLAVNLEGGQGAFSKSFHAVGKSTGAEDLRESRYLPINPSAPGVFEEDGSLVIRAALEEVVAIPSTLRDMIPRLDERALWPKRL